MRKKATGSKNNVVHVINSINISSLGTKDLAEVEAIIKEKVNASIKLYEQLKVLITMLVKYTQSFAGRPQSVDSLERITRRRSVNPDVLRTIRLVQYILAITIYLVKGDDRLLKEMKPAEDFFDRFPKLEKISIKDPVLLALYNEPLGKFVTDNNPQYRFVSLLSEILLAPEQENIVEDYAGFYHYKQQFDESIRVLVRSILCMLFYIAGSDNDKDIMRFFDESNEDKKMVLKRIIRDDANYINSKVDHSLRILKDASNYILTETKKDPSFIQKLLNKSYLENLLSDTALLHTRLKTMQSFVKRMRVIKDKLIGISYRVLDNTSEGIDELNKMMNSSAYQQLLLLVRDANSEGDKFFKHFQQVFGFFADYANSKEAAFAEALDNLEKNMTNGFRAVEVYLKIVPKMAEKLEDYRKNYSHVTLIEEGMSEFYKGLIHRISQIYVDFFPSQERGKIVYKHEKELDELLLIYKPMYGDRIRGITDPIIDNNNLFQGNSEYNLTRYIAKDDKKQDPDAIYHYYKKIMMIRSCAKALADFYGSLLDDNTSFDVTGLEDEIKAVMKRLEAIYNYSRNKIAELND